MIKDIVLRNRSYRGFNQNRKIGKEELLDMVDCARLTASSVNMQPFKYYIAWESEEVAHIQTLTKWARGLPELRLPHPGMCPTGFVVILQDMQINNNLQRFQKDCGIAAQTILLRATEMGLGGCMIGNFPAGDLRKTLDLPVDLAPLLVVAIGEPAETVVIREVESGESVNYYRDAEDVHYVPKRKLEDVVICRSHR